MALSEQEERERAKAVEEANSRSLFDDSLQTYVFSCIRPFTFSSSSSSHLFPTRNGAAQAQANPFPLVDAGLQPQFTQMQPQYTSFNPYLQEQQQAMMQAQWAQQQAEWQAAQQAAAQQEWARQQAEQQQLALQNEWARQQAEQQLAAQNEWMMQQQQQQQAQQNAWLQQQQQQPLFAQPTGFGSKNPFALGAAASSPPPPMPVMSGSATSINGQQQQQQQQKRPSPSPQPVQVKARPDENAALAALFANRDGGVDTFGNFGNLRYGVIPFAFAILTSFADMGRVVAS